MSHNGDGRTGRNALNDLELHVIMADDMTAAGGADFHRKLAGLGQARNRGGPLLAAVCGVLDGETFAVRQLGSDLMGLAVVDEYTAAGSTVDSLSSGGSVPVFTNHS